MSNFVSFNNGPTPVRIADNSQWLNYFPGGLDDVTRIAESAQRALINWWPNRGYKVCRIQPWGVIFRGFTGTPDIVLSAQIDRETTEYFIYELTLDDLDFMGEGDSALQRFWQTGKKFGKPCMKSLGRI